TTNPTGETQDHAAQTPSAGDRHPAFNPAEALPAPRPAVDCRAPMAQCQRSRLRARRSGRGGDSRPCRRKGSRVDRPLSVLPQLRAAGALTHDVSVEVASAEDIAHYEHMRRTGFAPEIRISRTDSAVERDQA